MSTLHTVYTSQSLFCRETNGCYWRMLSSSADKIFQRERIFLSYCVLYFFFYPWIDFDLRWFLEFIYWLYRVEGIGVKPMIFLSMQRVSDERKLGCVRLASLGRPRCVTVFFPGRTCADNYPRSPWKKKPPHTGIDPGKLNERTHNDPHKHASNLHGFPFTSSTDTVGHLWE